MFIYIDGFQRHKQRMFTCCNWITSLKSSEQMFNRPQMQWYFLWRMLHVSPAWTMKLGWMICFQMYLMLANSQVKNHMIKHLAGLHQRTLPFVLRLAFLIYSWWTHGKSSCKKKLHLWLNIICTLKEAFLLNKGSLMKVVTV